MLKTEISGINFENPLILAAGVMGSNASSLNWILDSGAGGVVTKSFSQEPNLGYSNPTTVAVEGGILNAIGLSSPGVQNFKKELALINKSNKDGQKNIAIASIYGSNPDEFSNLVHNIENDVDMIELNVSCPHAMSGCGAAIGQDPDLTYEIVKTVKNASSNNIPILAKLTPNVTDLMEIAKSAEKAEADGLTLINSLGPGMKIDIDAKKPILSNKFGGMSGPAIKPIAIRWVYDAYENCDIPIIGVGGISNYKDVVEFIYAGAKATQIGTSIMYEGIEIFSKIKNDLKNFMQKNEFNSIDEMIGYSHKN
ncbi:Dihydroorotate dehydrogenase [Candidatus Methanobinarius endosymbioticus]|uniref:Dihydroorotate dehydrogenase n=1 Tax=Candidatus Methanobinarius endosymbioticus TaxID=2006182 RepID=A0A366M8T4_9EURY|nr:Dihydroorotate dehydrogenase [Candidatus Methanobinarius endosymbioticus]